MDRADLISRKAGNCTPVIKRLKYRVAEEQCRRWWVGRQLCELRSNKLQFIPQFEQLGLY